MSPASYLAAPPRDAAAIVAPDDTIGGVWDWVVWASLAVAIVAGIAAMARAAVLVCCAWRVLKHSQRALFTELDRLAATADALGIKAASAGDASERLT